MSAPVDFRAIAANLPKRQRAAYSCLRSFWSTTAELRELACDPNVGKRLEELEAQGLAESQFGMGVHRKWRAVPQVVTGREHLLRLLRGLKAMVDAPPPVFALSEEQSKLLDEVNAVLSEGTKR